MSTIKFDLSKKGPAFKPLNSVNNGPYHRPPRRDNAHLFSNARIPYARTHDSVAYYMQGGSHIVDITAIFPDFNKNPYDPYSYDFAQTDLYLSWMIKAGVTPYYRLGQTIEHFVRKYGVVPPADFDKWAVICEHIIMHYNKGWANGFNYNIEYWEVWNEPDLEGDLAWTGTDDQFLDFFETALKHLKSRFPEYKFGGPAIVGSHKDWYVRFIEEMAARNVPLDFFSWHRYPSCPETMLKRADEVCAVLKQNGYTNIESHLTEWNYMCAIWDEQEITTDRESSYNFANEFRHTHGGAAHALAMMASAQYSPNIDIIMYYDALPTTLFNALFRFEDFSPYKAYYPFLWYGKFYDYEASIKPEGDIEEKVYSICGVNSQNKVIAAVTYYTDDVNEFETEKTVTLDFGKKGNYNVYIVDETHENELYYTGDNLTFTIKANTCLFIEEI